MQLPDQVRIGSVVIVREIKDLARFYLYNLLSFDDMNEKQSHYVPVFEVFL